MVVIFGIKVACAYATTRCKNIEEELKPITMSRMRQRHRRETTDSRR